MAYRETILADSPVAYWRLGEASGTTAADASGNGHAGTYAGGVTLGQSGTLISSTDKAASFDGSTGYVDCGHPSAFSFGGGDFTLELWAYPTSTALMMMLGKDNSGAREFAWHINDSGSGSVEMDLIGGGGASVYNAANGTVTVNAWNHLVVTRSGGSMALYVNGAAVTFTSVGAALSGNTMPTTTTSLEIGARAWPGNEAFFAGKIDEVALYGSALSAARVKAHYLAGTTFQGSAGFFGSF